MVSLTSLWLPILLSAVVVFIASSVIHMVLPIHRNDFRKLPDEDGVRNALRPFEVPPGDYLVPCAGSPKEMGDPAFVQKMKDGPVALLTVLPNGPPAMGSRLAFWFLYCAVVSLFAGYVASRALGPGAAYRAVFRFAGVTAFVGYALALWQNTIWWSRSFTTTLKSTIDGLVYAFLSAGVFGWLWPR